jgi:hypothetical protein
MRHQKFIGNNQRLHGLPRVTAAGRDCLVGCGFEPVGLSLWI